MEPESISSLQLKDIFEESFDRDARNAAILKFHTTPELQGQFRQPGHVYANAYFASVALNCPPAVQELLFEAFKEELDRQGLEFETTWEDAVKQSASTLSQELRAEHDGGGHHSPNDDGGDCSHRAPQLAA